jgi:alpha-galactosidase
MSGLPKGSALGSIRKTPMTHLAEIERTPQSLQVSTASLQMTYHLEMGIYDVVWHGGAALRGISCAVKFAGGTQLTASDYPQHLCGDDDITTVSDAFGQRTRIVIRHRAPGHPDMDQTFHVYPELPSYFVRIKVTGETSLASNDITPLVTDTAHAADGGLHLDTGGRPHTLFVPYDNDAWVRYSADTPAGGDSYEVTAVYDDESRHGFVLGAVTHDLWKTGITMGGVAERRVGDLRVYGGAVGTLTRDSQPHGIVTGNVLMSPQIFVGFFPDWRDGLEAYGRANAQIDPPMAWTGDAPFGWNSWAAYKETVSSAGYLAASDFIKATLQPGGFEDNGTVYINFDSFWTNLTEEQQIAAVQHVHANGQKAGTYWTPFACWGGDRTRPVEGTDGRWTYQDILLKDPSGAVLPALDGGLPFDPTHPGTLARIDWQLAKFVAQGFDFVKLDFVTHGALEGVHFDPAITTGTAAFRLGMARVLSNLDAAKIGRPFFISLSIAPLFPAGFGHSRRISCDAFGSIDQTEYMLNSLTYGWWQGGTLYHFNDPDHTVLYQEHGQQPTTEAEARSRQTASAIAGTVHLDSDDLSDPEAQARAVQFLTNPHVNALARSGRPFRPAESGIGDRAADTFVRTDSDGRSYVAVFNYSKTEPTSKHLDLSRLGLSTTDSYRVEDLWDGSVGHTHGSMSVDLPPADCRLLCLMPDQLTSGRSGAPGPPDP